MLETTNQKCHVIGAWEPPLEIGRSFKATTQCRTLKKFIYLFIYLHIY